MITIIHNRKFTFAWHIIGKSMYVPSDLVNDYTIGITEPNYPMPAIPTRVEYIFQGFATDGIFVRVDDYLVAGAYRDGMELIGYPCVPYSFDYPDEI